MRLPLRRVPVNPSRQAFRASPTECEPGSIWLGKGKDAVGTSAESGKALVPSSRGQ